MEIIVDTNFPLAAFRFGIDFESELSNLLGKFEIITSSEVIRELKRIAEGRSKDSGKAKLALAFFEKKAKIEESKMRVDGWILSRAGRNAAVCTNDFALARKLKEKGVRVIIVRGKQKLEFY